VGENDQDRKSPPKGKSPPRKLGGTEETRASVEDPPCWREAQERGDECVFCNVEACGTCGAGMTGGPRDCEHDVIERHNGPFYRGP